MRVQSLVPLAGILAAALLSGCGGGSTGSSAMSAPLTPQTIAFNDEGFVTQSFDTAAAVGVRLTGEAAFTTKTYGKILGYFPGTKSTTSHVVTIKVGSSVVFHNVDSIDPHTASFLGDASKSGAPWPATFNGSFNQSKAGTDISNAGFSTGTMSAGTNSLKYVAKVPGFYMFGCYFHYNSAGMRDIIIVQ